MPKDIAWRERLSALVPGEQLQWNAPMRDWTSMRVGGPADALVSAKTADEILRVLQFARREGVPLLVMGQGSNLIVRDGGIRGIVLRVALNEFRLQGCTMHVGAGQKLPMISREAMQKNLAGLEFAQGIPGSIGGAVVMNAGAYGGEISDVLHSVRYLDEALNVKERRIAPGDLSYRSSIFAREHWLVLGASFVLRRDVDGKAREHFDEYRRLRQEKQPLDLPSAGSVFKRPEGYFAGQLIEQAGLRGHSLGGAQVSPKHAGFIVNTGNATASDVIALIERIRSQIRDQFGVEMECEVKIVGDNV